MFAKSYFQIHTKCTGKVAFPYNTFYIGQGVSALLADRTADYTPMNSSEIPMAMERGILDIDAKT